jgi:hypothetical protein
MSAPGEAKTRRAGGARFCGGRLDTFGKALKFNEAEG